MKVFMILIIVFCCVFSSALFLSKFQSFVRDDLDFCLDTLICAEGLVLNVGDKTIIINEQTCSAQSGIWDEANKECDLRD